MADSVVRYLGYMKRQFNIQPAYLPHLKKGSFFGLTLICFPVFGFLPVYFP